MKIDYEWLLKVSCPDVVEEVKQVTGGFDETSIADIQITRDHTFESSGCRDQRIAVALIGNRGVVFEIRYWRNGKVDINVYYIHSAEVNLFSKY